MGVIYLEICQCCGFRIPKNKDIELGKQIPCSEYHIRCVRCEWPVAKTLISPEGLCVKCLTGTDRRAYHRKSGRMLYGEIDDDTDTEHYLVNGRMTMHGDEKQIVCERRKKHNGRPYIALYQDKVYEDVST